MVHSGPLKSRPEQGEGDKPALTEEGDTRLRNTVKSLFADREGKTGEKVSADDCRTIALTPLNSHRI
jgi:hypothetical protein